MFYSLARTQSTARSRGLEQQERAGGANLTALQALFRYYRNTEAMWARVYRDLEETPALQQPMAVVEIT